VKQGCEAERTNYSWIEKYVLAEIFSRMEVAPKHSPIQLDYKRLIEDKQAQLDRLVNFLMDGNTSDAVQRKIPEVEAELANLKKLSVKTRGFSPDEMVFSRAKGLFQKLQRTTDTQEVYDLRLKLQGELGRIVDEIRVSTKDHEEGGKFYRSVELFGLVSAVVNCELLPHGRNNSRRTTKLKRINAQ
jgi:hypothetical protein